MSMSAEARERERLRERPYSAASYAAQYGITLDDAEILRANYTNHKDIVRKIGRMIAEDPQLKRRALMLSETEGINRHNDEEEVRRAERILAGRSWKEVGREMA